MRVQSDPLAGSVASKTTGPEATRGIEHAGSSKTSQAAGGGSTDRVELSSLAGRISGAQQTLSAQRAAHVSALAELYRSGRYQPDIGSLSKKLADQFQTSTTPKSEPS